MKKTITKAKHHSSKNIKRSQKYSLGFIGFAIFLNFIIYKNIIIVAAPTLTQAFLVALIIFLLNYTALRLFEDIKKEIYNLMSLFYMTLPLWIFLIFYLIIVY